MIDVPKAIAALKTFHVDTTQSMNRRDTRRPTRKECDEQLLAECERQWKAKRRPVLYRMIATRFKRAMRRQFAADGSSTWEARHHQIDDRGTTVVPPCLIDSERFQLAASAIREDDELVAATCYDGRGVNARRVKRRLTAANQAGYLLSLRRASEGAVNG